MSPVQRQRTVHIGLSCFDLLREWSLINPSIKAEAERLGVEATIVESDTVADQLAAIDDMITQGFDGIIVSPIVSHCPEFIPLCLKARAAGISIVMIGSRVSGLESFPVVRSDHYGGQTLITDALFKRLGGKGRVAYIGGRPELEAHILRKRAFYDVLERYPDIELVFVGDHDLKWSYEERGRALATQLVDQLSKIDGIVVSVDFMALGVVDVLAKTGAAGRIAVTGFDGMLQAFHAIRDDKMFGTVARDAFRLIMQALEITLQLIRKEPVASETLVPVELVTRTNAADVAFKFLSYLPGALDLLAEDNKVRRQLIESLQREERFRSLVELSSDWYWEQDAQFRFVSIEGRSARFLNAMIGQTIWDLAGADLDDAKRQAQRFLMTEHLPFHDLEFEYTDASGKRCLLSLSGLPVFDRKGEFVRYRGVGKDITEQRRSAERIEYLAYYDVLTSLPNRTLFMQRLTQAMTEAKRQARQFAVLFVDVDRFKFVNDALGHEAGDQLLRTIGARLSGCLRHGDVVARFGDDEFVVLVGDIDSPDDAAGIARNLLEQIAAPTMIGDRESHVTASIGIAVYPSDGSDPQTLMKHADLAMNLAKEQGKNNYRFYSEATNRLWRDRLALESNLHRALQQNEFLVYYQPKIDIRSGAVCGMEALVRWKHPEWGIVPPAQFIPLAEEIGLIVPIGKCVLRAVCQQMVEWRAHGLTALPVAVNLSPRQFFDDGLVTDVAQVIKDTGFDPALLEFEITETVMMRNTEKAIEVLSALKSMGISLAIDDFGTGYSSFAQLKHLPIDTLKIDRAFIKDLPHNEKDSALIDAMISMGKALKLNIVAEGVETREQLSYLQKHSCDQFQGFFFSKPVPSADVVPLVRRRLLPKVETVK
jgi:diguanylate cyclase (GGDEF)-like protein/PAS domain S-box-containing protein